MSLIAAIMQKWARIKPYCLFPVVGKIPILRTCGGSLSLFFQMHTFCRGFMKILYYDCFAGISGDMNLAALIDLGVSPAYLKAELAKLAIDEEFTLQCQPEKCNGIQGMQVHVHLNGQQHGHTHGHVHTTVYEHGHAHGHEHTHGHSHENGHNADAAAHVHDNSTAQGSHLPHRNLAAISAIIAQSSLDDAVKQTSLSIFRRIAEAEAKVHGKALEDVHFHEVGATDSIVDIVGAVICFHALGVDAVWSSPLELGGGFVRCAHGMMPVPAPATVEILHGIPTTRGGVEHEATTPTGAAIIATLADAIKPAPAMTTLSTGYGIGHRQTERPNMLRVHLAEVNEAEAAAQAS